MARLGPRIAATAGGGVDHEDSIGAAQRDRRRLGEPTLYLSFDIVTAVGECTQGLTRRLQPLTICEYDVDCDPVVDLRDETGRTSHRVDMADLGCAWLSAQLGGRDPPSWKIKDTLAARGFCGALVPSFVPGAIATGANLVLWRWGPHMPCRVAVFDPSGRLPKNQLSWS